VRFSLREGRNKKYTSIQSKEAEKKKKNKLVQLGGNELRRAEVAKTLWGRVGGLGGWGFVEVWCWPDGPSDIIAFPGGGRTNFPLCPSLNALKDKRR